MPSPGAYLPRGVACGQDHELCAEVHLHELTGLEVTVFVLRSRGQLGSLPGSGRSA